MRGRLVDAGGPQDQAGQFLGAAILFSIQPVEMQIQRGLGFGVIGDRMLRHGQAVLRQEACAHRARIDHGRLDTQFGDQGLHQPGQGELAGDIAAPSGIFCLALGRKGLVRQLAERGLDLVLTARSAEHYAAMRLQQ